MRTFCLCLSALLLSAATLNADDAVKDKAPVKTAEVKIKDLTLQVPDTWKTTPSASSMRLATYAIPAADGDTDDGELTIFSFGGGGGSVVDNISRWIGQFSGEGRTSKTTKGMAGDNEYYFVDIVGTYQKPDGPPILRKTVAAPGYRMLGVILVLEGKGVYYLKLAGPDATIKAEAQNFRASFGGDSKTEKEIEL